MSAGNCDRRRLRQGNRCCTTHASLQASLRAQAMHVHSNLSNLIDGVERLILAASPKHLYASLFYSELRSRDTRVELRQCRTQCPMVLRWKDNECKIFTLESTGPPSGFWRDLSGRRKPCSLKPTMCWSCTRTEYGGGRAQEANRGAGAAQNRAARLPSLLAR